MPGNAACRGMCHRPRQGEGRNRRRDPPSLTGHLLLSRQGLYAGSCSECPVTSRRLRVTLLVRFRLFGVGAHRRLPGFGFALTLRFLLLLLCKVALAFRERVVGFRQERLHRLNRKPYRRRFTAAPLPRVQLGGVAGPPAPEPFVLRSRRGGSTFHLLLPATGSSAQGDSSCAVRVVE